MMSRMKSLRSTAMAAWTLASVLPACGKPPPPRPPPAELEITGPASFAGSWVADDDLSWGYTLAVAPDSKIYLVIILGQVGRCDQKGVLQPGPDPRTYQVVYEKNTCTPEL